MTNLNKILLFVACLSTGYALALTIGDVYLDRQVVAMLDRAKQQIVDERDAGDQAFDQCVEVLGECATRLQDCRGTWPDVREPSKRELKDL